MYYGIFHLPPYIACKENCTNIRILLFFSHNHTIYTLKHIHTHMTQICASRYEGVKLQLVTNTFYMHSFYIYRIYYHIQGDPSKWEILK